MKNVKTDALQSCLFYVYTKFVHILSILSQEIERNTKFRHQSRSITLTNLGKMTHYNPNLDLVNINLYTKFAQFQSMLSQDFERKQNSDINQGL